MKFNIGDKALVVRLLVNNKKVIVVTIIDIKNIDPISYEFCYDDDRNGGSFLLPIDKFEEQHFSLEDALIKNAEYFV